MTANRSAVLGGLFLVVLVAWFLVSPPRFWLNLTKPVAPTAAAGAQLVENYGLFERSRCQPLE
jgi:hypothetical protein